MRVVAKETAIVVGGWGWLSVVCEIGANGNGLQLSLRHGPGITTFVMPSSSPTPARPLKSQPVPWHTCVSAGGIGPTTVRLMNWGWPLNRRVEPCRRIGRWRCGCWWLVVASGWYTRHTGQWLAGVYVGHASTSSTSARYCYGLTMPWTAVDQRCLGLWLCRLPAVTTMAV